MEHQPDAWLLWLLLCCIATVSAMASGSQRFVTGDDGIHHFMMHGDIQASGGEGPVERVNLHIWLKGLTSPRGLWIRGFAYAESVNEDVAQGWNELECAQKSLVKDWRPHMYLESVASGQQYRVEVNIESVMLHNTARGDEFVVLAPLPLTGRIPADDSEHELALHISGWDRYIVYIPELHATPHTPADAGALPRVYSLLPPLRDISTLTASRLLARSLEYHARLGFAGTVAYTSPQQFTGLVQAPELQQYLGSGQLALVLWADVPENTRMPSCYKCLAYSHGILAKWGQNALLLVGDLDEYFATPSPAVGLQDVVAEIVNNQTLAMVMLTRYNVVCDDCSKGREDEAELDYWMQDNADHPVLHYTKLATLPIKQVIGKMLVHADRVLGFALHEGTPLPGYQVRYLPQDGAFVAHMYSLFRPRRLDNFTEVEDGVPHLPLEFENNTGWLWPLHAGKAGAVAPTTRVHIAHKATNRHLTRLKMGLARVLQG